MRFVHPWLLLLLLVPMAIAFWRWRAARPAASIFSAASIASAAGTTWRTRLRLLPGALRLLALAGVAVALARPQAGFGVVQTTADGVAIMMVLDRSSSMTSAMGPSRDAATRFETAQDAFQSFVLGDEESDLEGRPHDLLGLVGFARYPETIAPLTRATDADAQLAETVETARQRAEDGTAIGDAIALAAARLHEAEKELVARRDASEDELAEDFTIKSKVI